jgi:hypothetical protein
MTFSRSLLGTMLVAVFGALVQLGIGTPAGGATPAMSAHGFASAFYVAAASLAVALVCLLALKEKPLQTDIRN